MGTLLKRAVMAATATPAASVTVFPTEDQRDNIARIIFDDTRREVTHLGFGHMLAEALPPTTEDEIIDRVLAALRINKPGQLVKVTHEMLEDTMRVVHSDTIRALQSLGLGHATSRFEEPRVYCHEHQQFYTVSQIIEATSGRAQQAFRYQRA